jgi:hypothetical protein
MSFLQARSPLQRGAGYFRCDDEVVFAVEQSANKFGEKFGEFRCRSGTFGTVPFRFGIRAQNR